MVIQHNDLYLPETYIWRNIPTRVRTMALTAPMTTTREWTEIGVRSGMNAYSKSSFDRYSHRSSNVVADGILIVCRPICDYETWLRERLGEIMLAAIVNWWVDTLFGQYGYVAGASASLYAFYWEEDYTTDCLSDANDDEWQIKVACRVYDPTWNKQTKTQREHYICCV